MVMSFFRGSSESGLAHVEHQVIGMLTDTRHTFDAAMDALVAGADPSSLGDDIHETDQRVNQTEQEIRRELVVHASVHGTKDVGTILAYMLIIKKVERIGDQNKNIFDLAVEGVSFQEADDRGQLAKYRSELSSMFATCGELFTQPSDDRADAYLERCDRLLDEFDDLVLEQVHSHEEASQAVPRALLYRYLKRVAANLGGVVSSVVNPIDQIDYHDDSSDADE
jgi:phosphate uptake regulator